VLFIDNPIGTGFSVAARTEDIPLGQTTVADHLYHALETLFQGRVPRREASVPDRGVVRGEVRPCAGLQDPGQHPGSFLFREGSYWKGVQCHLTSKGSPLATGSLTPGPRYTFETKPRKLNTQLS